MKEFTGMAANSASNTCPRSFWSRWSDDDVKELVAYANQRHVGLWLGNTRRLFATPKPGTNFSTLPRPRLAGAKIDFSITSQRNNRLIKLCSKKPPEYHLLLNFPRRQQTTGEARNLAQRIES